LIFSVENASERVRRVVHPIAKTPEEGRARVVLAGMQFNFPLAHPSVAILSVRVAFSIVLCVAAEYN
jgi:hypothetical protein